MIRRLPIRLLGSAVVAAALRGQRRLPYAPRKALDDARDRRIRRMVAYAARHVPYYRELFAREGIDPSRIRTAADLDRLPVLDRELVRSRPELFVAQTWAGKRSLTFFTSGSTGTPIEIRHDRHSLLANIAYGERERAPLVKGCGSFRPRELYVGYETSTFKKVIAFYDESLLFPVRPRRRFVPLHQPIAEIAAIANAERPDVLVGYGGWIDLFFKTVAARAIEVHRPRMVLYMGEALPPGSRAFIEETFGVPVLSRYNAVESFKIGFYCEARTGFHVHEDLCHVRIVGPHGRDAAPGDAGQVVISNLVNRATVLLNYPLGDVASLTPEPCPCGRTLPLLSELEGRLEDILPLPGGGFAHPRSVWQVFKEDREVIQYQLTQRAPDHFALTLVTLDEPSFRRALDRALPELHRLLGEAARIEAVRRTEFLRAPGEKFRAVASLCRSRGVP